MTQVERQKWVLGLVAGNALVAAALLVVVVVLLYGRRGAAEAEELRDADVHGLRVHQLKLKTELDEARADLKATRAELDAVKAAQQRAEPEVRQRPSSSETQLGQTLQLLASQQQLLVLQSLRPVEAEKTAARPSARKSKSRVRRSAPAPVAPGCAVAP